MEQKNSSITQTKNPPKENLGDIKLKETNVMGGTFKTHIKCTGRMEKHTITKSYQELPSVQGSIMEASVQ